LHQVADLADLETVHRILELRHGLARRQPAQIAALLRRKLAPGVRYDAARARFTLPGSAVPLALMMGIFLTKYAVGVALSVAPALSRDAAFAAVVGGLYGAFSGVFGARALRLWRLALAEDRRLAIAA
jgi:hypothetical protein